MTADWVQEYGNDLIRALRGDYGQCPGCGNDLTRDDLANQADPETQARAELCVACWTKTVSPRENPMPPTELSERDAWLYLAGLWDNPTLSWDDNDTTTTVYAVVNGTPCSGLCPSISNLYHLAHPAVLTNAGVTFPTREAMLAGLRSHCAEIIGLDPAGVEFMRRRRGYWWPLCVEGAKARAAFCRRMAEEVSRSPAEKQP